MLKLLESVQRLTRLEMVLGLYIHVTEIKANASYLELQEFKTYFEFFSIGI